MSFSYLGTPLTRDIDAVREEVGDTLERDHLVEDEQIQYALTREGTVLNAAARVCEQLAARFASRDMFRSSNVSASKITVTAKYLMLAKILRGKSVTAGSFVVPSISVADKDENELDEDIVQPAFKKGMMANPEVGEEDESGVS